MLVVFGSKWFEAVRNGRRWLPFDCSNGQRNFGRLYGVRGRLHGRESEPFGALCRLHAEHFVNFGRTSVYRAQCSVGILCVLVNSISRRILGSDNCYSAFVMSTDRQRFGCKQKSFCFLWALRNVKSFFRIKKLFFPPSDTGWPNLMVVLSRKSVRKGL